VAALAAWSQTALSGCAVIWFGLANISRTARFGPAGDEPRQRGEPHPVCWFVPDPAGVAVQDRVLVPEHQQFSILRKVLTRYQDG
jgi:hypothetical protein